jgi:spore germination protein YaaH
MQSLSIALLTLVCLCAASVPGRAQDAPTPNGYGHDAPHARQSLQRPQPLQSESVPSAQNTTALHRAAGPLTHVVHGYHPYWISDATADSYRWDLLTHLAYFSYELDPTSGEPLTVRDWRTSTVIDRAKAEGVKVLLTVTNFGAASNRTFLSSAQARSIMITRVIELLQERGGHGVNIDFESLSGDQRENLVSFFEELRARLDAAITDAVISVAAPAVDWDGAWDVAALAPSIDLFFVMCYDYSWSGSSEAGPVAPIRGMNYNVDRTLRWYLDGGVPAAKLLMGVPYYGYDWPVVSEAPRAATTDRAVARTYSIIASSMPNRTRQWSETYLNPWIAYPGNPWQQLWYDDAESLGHKYQLVKDLGIAGIGMWALGYDAGYSELWDLIEQRFTRPVSVEAPVAAAFFSIWPQPLRPGEGGTIQYDGGATGYDGSTSDSRLGGTIAVYDVLGRRVAELGQLSISDNRVRFVVPDVTSGVYVLAGGSMRLRLLITAR